MKKRGLRAAIALAVVAACRVATRHPAPAEAVGPGRAYFADGFENASRFEDLFPRDLSRWHAQQREPRSSLIALTTEEVHTGRQALKLEAAPWGGGSKADIAIEALAFRRGDHVWSSVWYFLRRGRSEEHPIFLWDLEATRTTPQSPGRRLYLTGPDWVTSDLGKWQPRSVFRQSPSKAIPFPKDRWVRLRIHLLLSAGNDGRMEVWQDGARIIDATGQTLPTADSVYDRLQVGITANTDEKNKHTLYIDDVVISSEEID